jgi:hypothetical protein
MLILASFEIIDSTVYNINSNLHSGNLFHLKSQIARDDVMEHSGHA